MAILRLLFFLVAAFLIARFIRALFLSGGRPAARPGEGHLRGTDMVEDPSCGTYILKSKAIIEKIGGETHHFCSTECAERFRRAAMSDRPT